MKTLAIPTDDQKVRNRLRELYEPMTLFGEGAVDRRDRLKELVAEATMKGEEIEWDSSSDEDEGQKEEFYTYGIEELRIARRDILQYSIERCGSFLSRANARLEGHAKELTLPFASRKKARHEWYTGLNVRVGLI